MPPVVAARNKTMCHVVSVTHHIAFACESFTIFFNFFFYESEHSKKFTPGTSDELECGGPSQTAAALIRSLAACLAKDKIRVPFEMHDAKGFSRPCVCANCIIRTLCCCCCCFFCCCARTTHVLQFPTMRAHARAVPKITRVAYGNVRASQAQSAQNIFFFL